MRFLRIIFIGFLFVLLTACASNMSGGFGERPDVQRFIQKVSQKDDFNPQKLTALFNQVNTKPKTVLHHIRHPHETTMTWQRYRAIFITPLHIERGTEFWQQHRDTLQLAQQRYGVDPAIIVGIIGVETDYGKYLGKYKVLDALSVLAFNYPRRQHFFQSELEQYLLLTRQLNLNPLDLYGSYAGAVGLPQFMPSSYRRLAVSKNGGAPDLWHNPDDAILSVAHYFHHAGWRAGEPVAIEVSDCNNTLRLDNQCWQIYSNFNVIKRYNDKNFYAMAVYQLGQAIKNQQGK